MANSQIGITQIQKKQGAPPRNKPYQQIGHWENRQKSDYQKTTAEAKITLRRRRPHCGGEDHTAEAKTGGMPSLS